MASELSEFAEPIFSERRLSRIWREGAMTQMRGHAFALNPFGPPPNATNAGWSRWTMQRGSAWAAGYWWALKHRPKHAGVVPHGE